MANDFIVENSNSNQTVVRKRDGLYFSRRTLFAEYTVGADVIPLFHGDAFREIARLVDVGAFDECRVVREKLQRHDMKHR